MGRDCVVRVEYLGLVSGVLSCNQDVCVLPEGSTVSQLFQQLIERHGEDLRNCLFSSENKLRPVVEVYVDGREIRTLQGLATVFARDGSARQVSVIVGVYPFPGG